VSGTFTRVLAGDAPAAPPVWMMRQAGRYQQSYQALRRQHSFETLCREAELAAEVTLAPIREFDFDAAILFSDLLFPLEALGFGLSYDAGPPKLDQQLSLELCDRFRPTAEAASRLTFQRDAMAAARALLPPEKALLGFVGGPWTLFVYAMEGTHAGPLARSKTAEDLYAAFARHIVPLLIDNIRLQFDGGADLVMVLDTAAGELPPAMFHRLTAPHLAQLADAFPGRLGYYGKGLHPAHVADRAWMSRWAGVGYDARWEMSHVLTRPYRTGFAQGNFDPALLTADAPVFRRALDEFLSPMAALSPSERRGWICGLGHGVLPGTPERNVRAFVDTVRERFQ
jgi:uroporphyrinogen decarboxylase